MNLSPAISPRLIKEFRILVPIWAAAAAAVALPPLCTGFVNRTFCELLGSFGWVIGSAMLAVSTFSTEFQERTLPLLLSQPVTRWEQWIGKYKLLLPAVALLSALYWLIHEWPSSFPDGAIVLGCLVIASLGSAAFWSILARSMIGAIALSLATQALLLVVILNVTDVLGAHLTPPKLEVLSNSVGIAGLAVYASVFLVLGWKRFSTLEMVEAAPAASGISLGKYLSRFRFSRLWHCQPTGIIGNLIRKELVLHKWTFIITLLFAASVGIIALLEAIAGTRINKDLLWVQTTHLLPFGVYMPLVAVLAGGFTLCEEKTLGLHAWNLTLPVPLRTQFLVKLGVSVLLFLALGLVLPATLAWASGWLPSLAGNMIQADLIQFGSFPVCLFLVSLWAATLLRNVVHVALTAVAASFVLSVLSPLLITAINLSASSRWPIFKRYPGTTLFGTHLDVWDLRLSEFDFWLAQTVVWIAVAGLVVTLIHMSFRNFRNGQRPTRAFCRQAVLGVFAVLASCGVSLAIVQWSERHARNVSLVMFHLYPIVQELDSQNALRNPGEKRTYTVEELTDANLTIGPQAMPLRSETAVRILDALLQQHRLTPDLAGYQVTVETTERVSGEDRIVRVSTDPPVAGLHSFEMRLPK